MFLAYSSKSKGAYSLAFMCRCLAPLHFQFVLLRPKWSKACLVFITVIHVYDFLAIRFQLRIDKFNIVMIVSRLKIISHNIILFTRLKYL